MAAVKLGAPTVDNEVMGIAQRPDRALRRISSLGSEQLRGSSTLIMGVLMFTGGMLAGLTAVMPPGPERSEAAILLVAAVAFSIGVTLLLFRGLVLSDRAGGLLAAFGTVMITVATFAGGFTGTGTADNEMVYLWVALYAYYFFSLRHALLQLAFVGVAYAWLLSSDAGFQEAVTRMTVTLSTLAIAGFVIVSLRVAVDRLLAEHTELALHDSLTGAFNRHALDELAPGTIGRAADAGAPISFLTVDVDDFKGVNDRHGHPVGDDVLRQVAGALEHATREGDAIVRLGGDEFGVMLPGVSAAAARRIAERLRREIRGRSQELGVPVTLSIGLATDPGAGGSLPELWRAADDALYTAKREGGDNVRAAVRPTSVAA